MADLGPEPKGSRAAHLWIRGKRNETEALSRLRAHRRRVEQPGSLSWLRAAGPQKGPSPQALSARPTP